MKTSLSWLSLIGLVLSCQKQEEGLKALLVKERNCWIYHPRPEDESNASFTFCTKFSVSQDFFFNTYSFQNFQIRGDGGLMEAISIDGPNPNRGTWSFSDQDSAFSIGGNEFKMIRCNQDTIVLKTKQGHIELLTRIE